MDWQTRPIAQCVCDIIKVGDTKSQESAIDLGQVIRLVEMAQRHLTDEVRAAYGALETKASDCTQCGACKERCPFGVDITAKMEQAVAMFG